MAAGLWKRLNTLIGCLSDIAIQVLCAILRQRVTHLDDDARSNGHPYGQPTTAFYRFYQASFHDSLDYSFRQFKEILRGAFNYLLHFCHVTLPGHYPCKYVANVSTIRIIAGMSKIKYLSSEDP